MAKLLWDQVSEREYETGVDRGVLYTYGSDGYDKGVAWNGLTQVSESPSGAEANKIYADNRVYGTLYSAEEFGMTIQAYTYPDEFEECDGNRTLAKGITIGQQTRKKFGFSYRVLKGNDTDSTDHGYKIYIVYGCTASPSSKERSTVNDSPEALNFSWEVTTEPIDIDGMKTSAVMIIDSTKVDSDVLKKIEETLYGTETKEPQILLPSEIKSLIDGTTV